MVNPAPTRCPRRPDEEGYLLVAVIFMLAILIISLAVAVPRVRDDIQRDREIETMHRGKQYIRAIKLYYWKFHAYPPNIDALVKTNEIRFLRKRYLDPTTGKDDWKPIQFGMNKAPLAMGFFGQPLAGMPLAGIGPNGSNGLNGNGSNGLNGISTAGGSSSALGGGSTFSLGSTSPTTGTSPTTSTNSTTDSGASSGTTSTAGGTDSGAGSTSGSGTGPTGPTFGGAGIIGFSPASPKQSILVYKKKNHYNEWEFTYSPLADQQTVGGGNTGTIGQPPSTGPPTLNPTAPPTTTPPLPQQ